MNTFGFNGLGLQQQKLGDLSTLTTTEKSNLVGAINEVDADVALKANKTQEGWIAPTLINGWVTDPLTDQNGLGYYKDTLGVVTLLGSIRNGTTTDGTIVFTFPVGYRPNRLIRSVPVREAGGLSYISINVDGTVVLSSTIANNAFLAIPNIQFRAV